MTGLVRKLRWLVLFACCVGLLSCTRGAGTEPGGGGTIPAAPAPPLEIPSFLRFPTALSISVDGLSPGSGPSGLQGFKAQSADSIFAASIVGGLTGLFVDTQLDELNDLFDALQVPIDPSVRDFEKTVPFSSSVFDPGDTSCIPCVALELLEDIAFNATNGRFDPEGDLSGTVKIDFADFDADGDGSLDGCTGCTCPAGCNLNSCPAEIEVAELKPVCFRVWVDQNGDEIFERLIAGRFDQLPVPEVDGTPDNPGTGTYVQRYPFPSEPDLPDLGMRVNFDHADLTNRLTDFFLRSDGPVSEGVSTTLLDNLHAELTRDEIIVSGKEGEETSPRTLVNFAQECRFTGGGQCKSTLTVGRQVTRFADHTDLASLSGENLDADPTIEFSNSCVEIAAPSILLDRQMCIDDGIDVGGISFTDFVGAADVVYPSDFPTIPSF